MNRKKIKEWELEKGVELKVKNKEVFITEKQFQKLINTKNILVRTEKGREYLETMKGE